MVKQNSTRRSILDSPQVNCTACVHWVGEPTSIVKYHTKVDEKGVKKRHKISIPAVWVSHLEKGEAKLLRENVVDYEMVEVRQKWPTLDTQGNEVYVFLI